MKKNSKMDSEALQKGRWESIVREYLAALRVDTRRGTASAKRVAAVVVRWSNPSVRDITWRLRNGQRVRGQTGHM